MAGLDDCNILQPRHIVGSRLGGTHDSINVQNLSSNGFVCSSNQAMSRATKDHFAWRDLRILSIWRDSVPIQLRQIKIFECLVRWV
jgi:hypothetical protein